LEKLFPYGKTGKMSIEEAKDKVVKKFKENFEKNQLTYDEKTFLFVMNHLIDYTDNTSYFEIHVNINEIDNTDIQKNKNSTNFNKNDSLIHAQNIADSIIEDVINLCNDSKEEKEKSTNNILFTTPHKTDNKIEKQKKKFIKRIKDKNREENREKNLLDSPINRNSANGGVKKAFLSKRFYIKQ
jgi:hypothetical protein